MWAAVLALSLSIVLPASQFKADHLDSGSIDATPGPKLDKWMAEQREARRAAGLKELSNIDDETTLSELDPLVRKDSPVLQETLAAMRRLPHRQAEAILRFHGDFTFILNLLPDIDLQPTPELCGAIRGYLRRYLRQERANRPEPMGFVGASMQENIPSLGWISQHCDCDAELETSNGSPAPNSTRRRCVSSSQSWPKSERNSDPRRRYWFKYAIKSLHLLRREPRPRRCFSTSSGPACAVRAPTAPPPW